MREFERKLVDDYGSDYVDEQRTHLQWLISGGKRIINYEDYLIGACTNDFAGHKKESDDDKPTSTI